jgi:hypothetical protein
MAIPPILLKRSLSYPGISHKVTLVICKKLPFYDKIYTAEVFVSLYSFLNLRG